MSGFQLDTDHFGLADTIMRLISSKKTPRPKQIAEATDSLGNVAAQSRYGTVTIMDAECVYSLKSGSKNLNTLKVGKTAATTITTGIDGKTGNDAWPEITVKGVTGCVGLDSLAPAFTLPSITIVGRKIAQALRFAVGATGKLTGSTFSAKAAAHESLDSLANVASMSASGATFDVTGEATAITDAVTVTWDTAAPAMTETQKPGDDRSNTTYGAASFGGGRFLVKDT
jgi:hypothetical protein